MISSMSPTQVTAGDLKPLWHSLLFICTMTTGLSSMQDLYEIDACLEGCSTYGWDYAHIAWRLSFRNILPEIISEINLNFKKLRMPSGDFKEDRCTTSAQSTPSGTPSVTPCVTPSVTPCVSPHSSPALSRRSWFQLSPAPYLVPPELNSPTPGTDMGGNEGGGGERWSFFGTRSVVQKSPTDPGCETSTGFSLQSYFGMQKSSTMDGTKPQVNFKVDDPAALIPPKIEISGIEAKRAPTRPHKLKPRDMNVLTPSGF